MFIKFFLLFALVPMLELYILIKVGSIIGAGPTIVLVILTAIVGAYLAKQQGMHTMYRIRQSLSQNMLPAEELVDAFLILIAGLVLLTPGFITDLLGLLILFPPTRKSFKIWLYKKNSQWIDKGDVHVYYRKW
ncbi:FxsA family protein [Desulfohalobiaceae bacterium Ax17]|uniref:FxsA family protein n=1 Tax=Desulfovulcanus ferrireducens TaxID=2831190 RepID=UPI00207BA7C9|nr:FxsA family protein [Desulfovulcanus ferrireducens]MBT8764187.1 FxsA family protein [Desulfovulcanus ferrireducens]